MAKPAYLPPRRIYEGTPSVLTLDSRRRAYMGRIGMPEHRVYGVRVADDGEITLTPLVLADDSEASATSAVDGPMVVMRGPKEYADRVGLVDDPSRVERHEDNVWAELGKPRDPVPRQKPEPTPRPSDGMQEP